MSEQKNHAQPGFMLIRGGVILAVLGIVLFVLAVASGGTGNPVLTFGMVVVGLLLAILGYVKRGSSR